MSAEHDDTGTERATEHARTPGGGEPGIPDQSDLLLAPGFEALVRTLRVPGPRSLAALRRVVQELRDLAGMSYDEVIDELEALLDRLHPAERGRLDRFTMGAAVGEAFFEGLPAESVSDPITGLPDRNYLTQRGAEAVAHARWMGVPASSVWSLIVVRCPPATDLFEWLVQRHRLAETLRGCFRAGEPVTSVSAAVLVALVSQMAAADAFDDVRAALTPTGYPVEVWVEPVPDDLPSFRLLLDELARSPF